MNRRTFVRRSIAATIIASMAGFVPVQAQSPAHAKIIVPLSVGSTVDAVARVLSPSLGESLQRPVVVENRPGAAGLTGTQQIVSAAPDGTTVGMISSNHAINPSIYKNIPFDSIEDITPIAMVGTVPLVLVVHPSVEANSVEELIALLKRKPGEINFGSAGNGSTLHLAGELFAEQTGVKFVHIPYNGTGPLTTDLVGGQVDMAFVSVTAVAPHIRAGKLKGLAVSTKERIALLPDVPPISEVGLPGYEFDAWIALIGPASLPDAIASSYETAINKALANPKVQETLQLQGITVIHKPRAEMRDYFRAEQAKYAELVKRSGAKLE